MIFQNREGAGRELAARLERVVPRPCVVGAIPRGGVVVGLPIAERLAAPLAVVHARKLGVPSWPELAFGALDEDGLDVLDRATVRAVGLDPGAIEAARERGKREVLEHISLYRAPRLADFLPGPAVVIVDDGLATGLTVLVAVRYARRHGASDITVAVPCASDEAVGRIGREADRIVSLVTDPGFRGVSQYYVDFSQVTDDEVVARLARAGVPRGEPASSVTECRPARSGREV